jgi:hypothetical protein
VLRTYRSALVYDVDEGASLASVWRQQPRVYRLDDGVKGEGITYRANSEDLITLGEGASPTLYRTAWQC